MGADKGFPAPYVLRSALPLTLHDCFPNHCEKIFFNFDLSGDIGCHATFILFFLVTLC